MFFFLIKKRTSNLISKCPVFLTGDFSPKEIVEFKQEQVAAFLSIPLNPIALVERIYLNLNLPIEENSKKTPMLFDVNIRNNIIMIQIEGNLVPGKLEILNYLIRSFCKKNDIKKPKFLIIIPSLYPENITLANLERLFKFNTYPELTIEPQNVKILTNIEKFKKLLTSSEFKIFELAKEFYEAIQTLQIDFEKEKNVPVDFLKVDNFYIFDLFDKQGNRLIPAMTTVTDEMLKAIKEKEIRSLTYYSDKELSAIDMNEDGTEFTGSTKVLFDFFTSEFEPIESQSAALEVIDEKKSLFFRNLKGQNALVVSKNKGITELLKASLEDYFKFDLLSGGTNIDSLLKVKRFAIIFLDAEHNGDQIETLKKIRAFATRRKTSVLVLFNKIDKSTVIRFKNSGTDNIILSPYSSSKILNKVFQSVNQDRGL